MVSFNILFQLMIPGVSLALIFKQKIAVALTFVAFGDIIIIYLSGIATDLLVYGDYICVSLIPLAIIYFICRIMSDCKFFIQELHSYVLNNGLLVFLFLFFWLQIFHMDRVFTSWDEFSHWGLVVKNMCLFDRFGTYEYANVSFRGYPPGTAIFEYFVTWLQGGFAEQYVYQAFTLLTVLLVLPLTVFLDKRKKFPLLFLLLLIMAFTKWFYSEYLITLYVDSTLGLLFGLLLVYVSSTEEYNTFTCLFVFTGMSVLCLIKASGLFFGVIVGILWLLFLYKNSINRGKTLSQKLKFILPAFISVLLSFLLGNVLWKNYLLWTHTQAAWNTASINIVNIIEFLKGIAPEYRYNVLHDFLMKIFFDMSALHIPFLLWVVLTATALWLLSRRKDLCGDERNQARISAAVLTVGMCMYALGMLLLYLFTYSEYEALHLASYGRYMATPLLGGYMLVFFLFVKSKVTSPYSRTGKAVIIVMLLLTVPVAVKSMQPFDFYGEIAKGHAMRAKYAGVREYLPMLDVKKKPMLGVISQGDRGFDSWCIKMEVTPIQVGGTPISLGKPYYNGDIWTKDVSPQEWIDSMKKNKLTHLYLYYIDEKFITDYGECFITPPEKGKMYYLTDDGKLCEVNR